VATAGVLAGSVLLSGQALPLPWAVEDDATIAGEVVVEPPTTADIASLINEGFLQPE
jgi:hypothetical protein